MESRNGNEGPCMRPTSDVQSGMLVPDWWDGLHENMILIPISEPRKAFCFI